jgi:DNA-binding transcriptional LysR family regulator
MHARVRLSAVRLRMPSSPRIFHDVVRLDRGGSPNLSGGCIEIASNDAIREVAQLGLGIPCLSRWLVADAIESGRLVARALDGAATAGAQRAPSCRYTSAETRASSARSASAESA